MKTKLDEILVDYIEGELTAEDRRIIEGELKSSIKLRQEVRDLQSVRTEIKNTRETFSDRTYSEADLGKLHDRIMMQLTSFQVDTESTENHDVKKNS